MMAGVYPASVFADGRNVSGWIVVNNSKELRKHFILVVAFFLGLVFLITCCFSLCLALPDFSWIGGQFVQGRMACLSHRGQYRIVLIMQRHFCTASGLKPIAVTFDELDRRAGVDLVLWRDLGGEDAVSNDG